MKTVGGNLAPADQQALDYVAKLPVGRPVLVNVVRHRNPAFHAKFMALLTLAFQSWEPTQRLYRDQVVAKNFEQFRKEITILAGFYDASYSLKDEVRLTAKSISFANMGQDDFELLYSAAANVILSRILTRYTRADLDEVVEKILGFV